MQLIVTIDVKFDAEDPDPKVFDITELEDEISGVVSRCQGFEDCCWVGPVTIDFKSGAKPTPKRRKRK